MNEHLCEWGPIESAPLDPLALKAGRAVLERAPVHILEAWQEEALSTAEAYRLTLALEAGQLFPAGGRP